MGQVNRDGERILFTEDTLLTLVMKDDRLIEETYKSIRSHGGVFEGITTDGEVVVAAMAEVIVAFVRTRAVEPPHPG